MTDVAQLLADNLARLREQIAAAAERSGRNVAEVTLVGVTKYIDDAATRLIAAAGCRDLGESRPQQLWRKAELLSDLEVRWHMIGHLQRNKVERTVASAAWIHSIDSERLLQAVDLSAANQSRQVNVLLEVNISGDASKHGLAPKEVEPLLELAATLPAARVRGLMAMAGLDTGPEEARADFRRLRQLRDSLAHWESEQVSLRELSMGMSGDFVQAIEEGATFVRVGSALVAGMER